MAEAALGLALGGLGLVGLFTACVQCFEMIESGANYARDLQILYTGYESQRVRLITWGEAVGIGSSQDPLLARPDVQAAVQRGLNCIRMLFDDGAVLISKYGLQRATENEIARGSAFRETFRRFRERMVISQAQAPLIQTAKWAIRSKTKFQVLVSELRTLIDDLEKVTHSPEIIRRRQVIVDYEIASISDEHSLQLIEDSVGTVDRQLSDAASSRLREIRDGAEVSSVERSSVTTTFWSACSNAFAGDRIGNDDDRVPAASQESQVTERMRNETSYPMPGSRPVQSEKLRPIQPFVPTTVLHREPVLYSEEDRSAIVEDLVKAQMPRTRKLMISIVQGLVAGHKESNWRLGLSRIDTVARALVCFFEGPHGSPYEGGIFYLRFFMTEDFPFKPPVCQMLTRIYHPNFDSRGRVCLDVLYKEWSPVLYVYGTLLSVATLLDDTDVSDPLVPEVAAQCMRDRATFDKIARDYTIKYATSEIPNMPNTYGDKPWWEAVKISL